MERMTKRSEETTHENGVCCTHFGGSECCEVGGNCALNCKWEEAAWERLAEYEDAGLLPEEFSAYQAENQRLQAAIDAVPVVRCRDCKHCRELNREDRIEEAYADGVLWCKNQLDGVWPDDFCSYGERRESK